MELRGRDRQLVVVAAVLVVAWLGWVLWVGPSLERSARAQEQIGRKERQLEELIRLRARWDDLQQQRAAVEERLVRRGKGFSVAGGLRSAAARAGVAGMGKDTKETSAVQEGRYKRRAAEVGLEGLTVDQLVGYLYEVEDPKDMMRVDRLEVRPHADNPAYLDVSLAVSSVEAPPK